MRALLLFLLFQSALLAQIPKATVSTGSGGGGSNVTTCNPPTVTTNCVPETNANGVISISGTILGPRTIASGANQLPTASACPNCTTYVNDGISATDTTTGGGSTIVCVVSNGTVWQTCAQGIAGPAGPAGPVGPPGPAGADGAPGTPGYSPNSLISGGGVAYSGSGLTFVVSAATYFIGNVQYTSPQSSLTLSAANASLDRIDVIAVNSSGTAVIITGTPAAAPALPAVDPSSQLQLTWIYVAANATTPTNVVFDDIYHEGTEWTPTRSGTPITLNSLNNPYDGTKDIEATTAVTGNYFQFAKGSTFNPATRNNLVFYIRSKATWASTRSIQIQWYASTKAVGSIVVLNEKAFGFTSTNTTTYQQIVIPMSLFAASGLSVDTLRFTVSGSGSGIGFYFDDSTLQGGVSSAASASMSWKGSWNASTAYAVNDVVTYNGVQWIGMVANTNSAPSSTNINWAASAGGTGTVLTIPFYQEYVAGVCQGATASLGFSLASSNTPTAVCITGTNTTFGVAEFTATGQTVQGRFILPDDWTSGAGNDLAIRFRSAGTTGNVVWNLQTACVASTGATQDPSWNTAQTVSTAAQGTTLLDNTGTISTITTTGCSAGNMFFFKVGLDASTTTTGNQDMFSIRFKLKRTITSL